MESSSWREGNNEDVDAEGKKREGAPKRRVRQGRNPGKYWRGRSSLKLTPDFKDATNFTRAAADASTST